MLPFLSFSSINKDIKPEIISEFEMFFDKGWYVLGEKVKEFENENDLPLRQEGQEGCKEKGRLGITNKCEFTNGVVKK